MADKRELNGWLDAKHPHWARQEAATLLGAADRDRDSRLSLPELLARPALLLAALQAQQRTHWLLLTSIMVSV